MSRKIRFAVAFAALIMSAAYALPLWRIALIAPQYPEGLGMLIRVNAIDGFKEGDLQSINGLNHYIGMKTIEPDAIPELRLMPVILGVLIVTGLGVAALGRRAPFVVWAIALGAVCTVGLVDFWRWGYDYGHNLDPHAIIKVPGMTYQPPLIGSKKLLNFTATSWPASGGWALIAATGIVAGALVLTFRRRTVRATAGVAALVMAAACGGGGPHTVALNEDDCDFCRMTISDARFGGQAVTKNGRAYLFDSIECLAGWARANPAEAVRAMYVVDVQHPGTWVPVTEAGFIKGALIKSPMGGAVVAFATPAAAEGQRTMLGGTTTTWAALLADTAAAHAGH